MKVNINNKIAHMADLHVQFGSRHDEHEIVFRRTVEDIQKNKPRRIIIAGDLFHQKINMSPSSVRLIGKFLSDLSQIAPVDIILGNHDLSLSSISQGNCIEPIINLIDNGVVVKKGEGVIPKLSGKNGIYFYPHSGFYKIDDDLIYGVYSCLDNEMLNLKYKDRHKDTTYIALFHGQMYGYRADNGIEMKGNDLIRASVFDNFDMVIMGDIHEYQTLQEYSIEKNKILPVINYSGSLSQNGYAENIEKSYNLWDLSTKEHERRYIPNDFGWAKITISKGENIEDRIQDLQFSLNKKKTKVWIDLEDDEENYSVEKLHQVRRMVRTKYGCEIINVEFKPIYKEKILNEEGLNSSIDENTAVNDFHNLLIEFLKQNDYDDVDEVLQLSDEIDEKLNYTPPKFAKMSWRINKMTVHNILSFGENESTFDFDRMEGVVGIFGENYTGKSNVIKALVWGLYQKILGDGEPTKIVNIYSKSNVGYVKVYFTIAGQQYYCYREATVKTKKDGTQEVSYKTEYKILKKEEFALADVTNGNETNESQWIDVDSSESAAVEKKERKKLIAETVGNFDDFTKVCLQSQSGVKDYLLLTQPEKDLMVSRFLGLEIFKDRYKLANEEFKRIRYNIGSLGNASELEINITELKSKNEKNKISLSNSKKEKAKNNGYIDEINLKIRELSSKLQKTEFVEENDKKILNQRIEYNKNKILDLSTTESQLNDWLDKNRMKDIPEEYKNLRSEQQIERELIDIRTAFSVNKDKYTELDKLVKTNAKKEEIDYKPIEDSILEIRNEINILNNKAKIARGEKCPTCQHVKQAPDPELENKCIVDISIAEKKITSLQEQINSCKKIIFDNNNYDKQLNALESLRNALTSDKLHIDKLKNEIQYAKNIDVIKMHNEIVKDNARKLNDTIKTKQEAEKSIEIIIDTIAKIDRNAKIIVDNSEYNEEIKSLDEQVKEYKTVNLQFENIISNLNTEVRMADNEILQYQQRLENLKEEEKKYKKYSIYLQSVDKQGIPSKIIAKKLALINHRINSMLNNIVEFKLELYLKSNSDIKEHVFFKEEKTDSLPVSMSSGSQRFLGSLAIRQALQSVSSLSRPQLFIIDEGMDSLDQNKIQSMSTVLQMLKNKFAHVLVISHNSSIKDFCDYTISVSKTINDTANKEIGFTQIEIS